MTKSYRFILAALLISLIAGTAMANEKGAPSQWYTLTEVDATDSPSGRDVMILSYDFGAMPIDYVAAGVQYGTQGLLPADAAMVGFGFDNVTADIYFNDGASFSNWASECFIGCTYDDMGTLSFVGTTPFAENDGPGSFGPSSNYFALVPTDWPMPTTEEFTFYASANWDDGTGLPAGTVTGGTVYVEIETAAVGSEEVSMGAVKALYR